MSIHGAGERITAAVASWEGVTIHPDESRRTHYLLGSREIGHVHGDGLVDLPLPTRVRDEVIAAGEARPHHALPPDSDWVTVYLREAEDVERAIALLHRSYDVAVQERHEAPAGGHSGGDEETPREEGLAVR
jgi:luciferase-like monooxygenase